MVYYKDSSSNLKLRIYSSGPYVNELSKHLEKIGVKHSISPSQPFEKYIETLSKTSLFGLLSEKGVISTIS